MLDDLRNSASQSFLEDFPDDNNRGGDDRGPLLIFGMTAAQRFLVAFLLLILVCTVGTLVLIAFGKVVI